MFAPEEPVVAREDQQRAVSDAGPIDRVKNPADLEGAYAEAFAMKDRFVFMDIIVDPSENVYPMIEAGKGHHEMHLSPHLSSDRELA